MSNLISTNIEKTEEIILTQFETAQGWKVKIDLKTNNIYLSTSDISTLLGRVMSGSVTRDLGSAKISEHLRALDLSDQRKELKVNGSPPAMCFDIEQSIAILDFFNAPILKISQRFGLEVAIKQACGLLEKPQQPQLTPTQAIKMMMPAFELAEQNPGIGELAAKVNTIPCLIISEKPFTLRFWVQVHFLGYDLSRQSLTRFGRQVAATYQQHKLELPTNGYTPSANKYTRADHDLICQVFQTMLDQGQLEP
jgi:hypothetical protein